MIVDGLSRVVGAASCNSAASSYRDAINQRMGQTAWMSPVSIAADMAIGPWNATLTATYRLVDPVQLTDLQATLLLYEDNVEWCCGYDGVHTWQGVTRRIYDQSVTLPGHGDQVTVTIAFPIAGDWNPAELHAVAFLQNAVTKEIIQGALVRDYSILFDSHVDSVPDGDGTGIFHGVLRNLRPTPEDFLLRIATPFGDWPTEFFVCDDPSPHTLPVQVRLPSGASCDIWLRAHTDATKTVRGGTFEVTCQGSGRTEQGAFRLFNRGPAILVVDNDGGSNYDLQLIHALDANGYPYDEWDALVHLGTPPLSRMNGFDILIWASAGRVLDVLTGGDAEDLMAFMDRGGSLFVETNYYLNSLGYENNRFARDYLGVDSWTLDRGYVEMNGVAGDTIGDGIALALDFRFPTWAEGGDDAVPGSTGATDFLGEEGSHAMIRNTMANASRSIFMPQRFDAVSETDPDPNNAKTLVRRIVEWLKPEGSADAPHGSGAAFTSRIEQASPNPFHGRSDIRFTLSSVAARAPVRLEVFDPGGRMIAKLLDGVLPPGEHFRSWDGRRAGGRMAVTGVYLARLSTCEGTESAKLILIR